MAPGLLLQSLFLLQLLCLAVVVCFGAFDAAVGAVRLCPPHRLLRLFRHVAPKFVLLIAAVTRPSKRLDSEPGQSIVGEDFFASFRRTGFPLEAPRVVFCRHYPAHGHCIGLAVAALYMRGYDLLEPHEAQ